MAETHPGELGQAAELLGEIGRPARRESVRPASVDRLQWLDETLLLEPIPGWLVTRLIFTVGLSEEDVARMTVEEAQAAWVQFQTGPPGGDA